MKILLVEDNESFRCTVKRLLEERFPEVHILDEADGTAGWETFRNARPDLIIVDIKLPGMNGLDLTRRVREIDQDCAVIVFTSFDFPEYRQAAVERGADYFMSKGSASSEDVVQLVGRIRAERRRTAGNGHGDSVFTNECG